MTTDTGELIATLERAEEVSVLARAALMEALRPAILSALRLGQEAQERLAEADAALTIMDDYVMPNVEWDDWVMAAFEAAQSRHTARQHEGSDGKAD